MPQQSGQPEPQWQPISKVFLSGTMIDGMLQGAREQYATLREGRPTSHVLDDYTVARVVQVSTQQRDDLWLWDEQLRRWAAEDLTPLRRREVERLQGQMVALHKVVDEILTLADELGAGTIERVLAKDDAELGLETLLRMMGRHGEQDK